MSRFSRLHGGPTHTWAPPESLFQIEYTTALLREVRIASGVVDAFGVLYGVRHGQTIRLVSTRGRAGLDPVGVFASRVRGQVFLTEEDLERFEKAEASVALVISGENAGFFVRDAAGAIETVRSYHEFSIHGPIEPPPVVVVKKRRWVWALLLCIALIPLTFFKPRHTALALTLRETDGQLRIAWNVPTTSTLTILDGGERTYVPITPDQSTATYARRSGDVTVGINSAQLRFVGPGLPLTEMERIRDDVEVLEAKVVSLRAAQVQGRTRIAALQRRLQ